MSTTTLTCDQAIFTSVRTPMGEGYRIIAASRGLHATEKQAITRSSPSHDALCWPPDETTDTWGLAFYALPGGRLCVALSYFAGAEQTGRGGQRVYTHNVVFDKDDFPKCAYNPFAVLRAMIKAQLTTPQLKPPPILPELELSINDAMPETTGQVAAPDDPSIPVDQASRSHSPDLRAALSAAWRGHILNALMEERSLIVNLTGGWTGVVEGLLTGLPGPMRADVSFSAGLRFSVGRCHRLALLHDDHGVTKSRIMGRRLEYVDPAGKDKPDTSSSAWLSFVERHWGSGDSATLARRTSQAFPDIGPAGRERVGRLYNRIDALPQTDTAELLSAVAEDLNTAEREVEADILAELLVKAQGMLVDRLGKMAWEEVRPHWPTLCTLTRKSTEARLFVQPLIEQAVGVATAEHPLVGARAALDLPRNIPDSQASPGAPRPKTGPDEVVDTVLTRVAEWAEGAADADIEKHRSKDPNLDDLVAQWRSARPQCPIVQRIHQRCSCAQPITAASVGEQQAHKNT